MILQIASLILACIGILATGGVAWYVYKRTKDMTVKMQDYLVTLIVNSASNPKVLRDLLKDVERSGNWRGEIVKDPNKQGNYRINWHPQEITPIGIPSAEAFGKTTLIQHKPKRNQEM